MPRGQKPRADRPVEKTINLPQSIASRVDLELWSELEQRVPHGAWSRLVSALLTAWLDKVKEGDDGERQAG